MAQLHHYADHPRFGLPGAKMQQTNMALLADVAQFVGEQRFNVPFNHRQQLYAAPSYCDHGEFDLYRRCPPPYQAQPLSLNSFIENDGLIDEAQYYQQRRPCPPQHAMWRNGFPDQQVMGAHWDGDASRRPTQPPQWQQQWDQDSHASTVGQDSAPSVVLGLVQATPPQSPPSEVEAPPSSKDGRITSRMPFVVQNTFLNVPTARSPSLEPFYKERLVKSSPPSGPSSGTQTPATNLTQELTREHVDNPRIPHWLRPRRQDCSEGRNGLEPGFQAVAAAARLTKEFGCGDRADVTATVGRQRMTPANAYLANGYQEQLVRVDAPHMGLNNEDLPVLGTEDCPNIGSQLHFVGGCKPCAFVLSEEGCQNGSECQFCHLCEPGEKKRRKKERLAIRREARQEARRQRQANTMGWNL